MTRMFLLIVAVLSTFNMYNRSALAQVSIVTHVDGIAGASLVLECQVTSFGTGPATWSNDYGVTVLTRCFSAAGVCTTTGIGTNYNYTSDSNGINVTIAELTSSEKGKTWTCSYKTYNDTYTVPEASSTTKASTLFVQDVMVSTSMSLLFDKGVTTRTPSTVSVGSYFDIQTINKSFNNGITRTSDMLSSIQSNFLYSDNSSIDIFQDSSFVFDTEIITSSYTPSLFFEHKPSLSSITTQYVPYQTIAETVYSEADISNFWETIFKTKTSVLVSTPSFIFETSNFELTNTDFISPDGYSFLSSSKQNVNSTFVLSSDESGPISLTNSMDILFDKTHAMLISTLSSLFKTDSLPYTNLNHQSTEKSVLTTFTEDLRANIKTYTKGYTAYVSPHVRISQVSEYLTTTTQLKINSTRLFLPTTTNVNVTDKESTVKRLSLFTFDTPSNMRHLQSLELSSVSITSTDSMTKLIDFTSNFKTTNVRNYVRSAETSSAGTASTFIDATSAVKAIDVLILETQSHIHTSEFLSEQSFIKYNSDVPTSDYSLTLDIEKLTRVDNSYPTIDSSLKYSSISHTLYGSFLLYDIKPSSMSFESDTLSLAYISTNIYQISTTKARGLEENDFIFITTTSAVVFTIVVILLIMFLVKVRLLKESDTSETDTNDKSLSNERRSNKRAFSEYLYVGKNIYPLYNSATFSNAVHHYENNWKDLV